MAVGDGALARIGGDDRRRQEFRERRKPVAGFGIVHALASPKQRMLGGKQHLHGLLDRRRIRRGTLHRDRPVIERAFEFRLEYFVRHFDEHRPGFARAHGVIGAPHQVRQFVHVMRQRRPLGHRAIDVGGAEHGPHILPRQRQPAGDDKQRHVLRIGLRDAGEGIFDARSGLGGEHAILLAAFDARITVGDADADAFLPAQDRADVDCRTGFDHRIARIAGQEFGTLTLENFGNDRSAVHGVRSPA